MIALYSGHSQKFNNLQKINIAYNSIKLLVESNSISKHLVGRYLDFVIFTNFENLSCHFEYCICLFHWCEPKNNIHFTDKSIEGTHRLIDKQLILVQLNQNICGGIRFRYLECDFYCWKHMTNRLTLVFTSYFDLLNGLMWDYQKVSKFQILWNCTQYLLCKKFYSNFSAAHITNSTFQQLYQQRRRFCKYLIII